jgi:hypothetical protein
VTIDEDIIEVVEDFAYLGSNIHKGGDKFHEITRIINLVYKTCFSLLHIFKSKYWIEAVEDDSKMILGTRYWQDKQWLNKGGEIIFRWPRPNTRLLCLRRWRKRR